jgi:hypothetical protein
MTGPDFDALVGDEGTPEELDRLRRVHELLVAAGPPPELSPRLRDAPPTPARVSFLPRRRRTALALVAAALVAVAFGVGYLTGGRGEGFDATRAVEMHGVGPSAGAAASILLGKTDAVGNVPLEMRVHGLKQLDGGWYVLLLTKDGKPLAVCGTFAVGGDGKADVRMSVAYDLKRYDGWVVNAFFPRERRTTGILLTT